MRKLLFYEHKIGTFQGFSPSVTVIIYIGNRYYNTEYVRNGYTCAVLHRIIIICLRMMYIIGTQD